MVTRHGELCEYDSRNGLCRKRGTAHSVRQNLLGIFFLTFTLLVISFVSQRMQ